MTLPATIRKSFGVDIRRPVKYILSKKERALQIREAAAKKDQNQSIAQIPSDIAHLVLFLLPGLDRVTHKELINGGIMSIASFCEESQKLMGSAGTHAAPAFSTASGHTHSPGGPMAPHSNGSAGTSETPGSSAASDGSSAYLATTFPNDLILSKFTLFENKLKVFRFGQFPGKFKKLDSLLIHIPEFMVPDFADALTHKEKSWLQSIGHLHINVMNQNVRLMPDPDGIRSLEALTPRLTITTAHQKYCTRENREKYGIPFHKLSVPVTPERYIFKKYRDKENILILSPDDTEKNRIVTEILSKIEGLQVCVIRNMSYKQYQEIISRAKWSLTFGEGLDGYLVEPILSGAIGFGIYNEEFFTPDFKEWSTIYPSYETLLASIVADINKWDKEADFTRYQQQQFDLCASYYSYEQYRRNIKAFYAGDYTFK